MCPAQWCGILYIFHGICSAPSLFRIVARHSVFADRFASSLIDPSLMSAAPIDEWDALLASDETEVLVSMLESALVTPTSMDYACDLAQHVAQHLFPHSRCLTRRELCDRTVLCGCSSSGAPSPSTLTLPVPSRHDAREVLYTLLALSPAAVLLQPYSTLVSVCYRQLLVDVVQRHRRSRTAATTGVPRTSCELLVSSVVPHGRVGGTGVDKRNVTPEQTTINGSSSTATCSTSRTIHYADAKESKGTGEVVRACSSVRHAMQPWAQDVLEALYRNILPHLPRHDAQPAPARFTLDPTNTADMRLPSSAAADITATREGDANGKDAMRMLQEEDEEVDEEERESLARHSHVLSAIPIGNIWLDLLAEMHATSSLPPENVSDALCALYVAVMGASCGRTVVQCVLGESRSAALMRPLSPSSSASSSSTLSSSRVGTAGRHHVTYEPADRVHISPYSTNTIEAVASTKERASHVNRCGASTSHNEAAYCAMQRWTRDCVDMLAALRACDEDETASYDRNDTTSPTGWVTLCEEESCAEVQTWLWWTLTSSPRWWARHSNESLNKTIEDYTIQRRRNRHTRTTHRYTSSAAHDDATREPSVLSVASSSSFSSSALSLPDETNEPKRGGAGKLTAARLLLLASISTLFTSAAHTQHQQLHAVLWQSAGLCTATRPEQRLEDGLLWSLFHEALEQSAVCGPVLQTLLLLLMDTLTAVAPGSVQHDAEEMLWAQTIALEQQKQQQQQPSKQQQFSHQTHSFSCHTNAPGSQTVEDEEDETANEVDSTDGVRCYSDAFAALLQLLHQLITTGVICPRRLPRQLARAAMSELLIRLRTVTRVRVCVEAMRVCPYGSVVAALLQRVLADAQVYMAQHHNLDELANSMSSSSGSSGSSMLSYNLWERYFPVALMQCVRAWLRRMVCDRSLDNPFVTPVVMGLNFWRVLLSQDRRRGATHATSRLSWAPVTLVAPHRDTHAHLQRTDDDDATNVDVHDGQVCPARENNGAHASCVPAMAWKWAGEGLLSLRDTRVRDGEAADNTHAEEVHWWWWYRAVRQLRREVLPLCRTMLASAGAEGGRGAEKSPEEGVCGLWTGPRLGALDAFALESAVEALEEMVMR